MRKRAAARSSSSPALSSREATALDNSILESKIGYQIRMTDRVLGRDFLDYVGLTRPQYSVLSLVATNDDLSQAEVGKSLDMDRASTMAVVDKLESAGMIERRISAVDKRMHALQLTEAGRKAFPALNRKVVEHENSYMKRLSATEQTLLFECLTKIRQGTAE